MTLATRHSSDYLAFVRKPGAIPELDGLRAIAVMLVLARHIFRPLQERDPDMMVAFGYDFATPFVNGWVGVDLFFVLSGFLISRHLLSRHRQGRTVDMGAYLGARALRILPAYFAVLGLVLVGAFPFYAPEVGLRSVLVHLSIMQDYLGSDIVVAFWSLGVEEKFYLCAPLIVLVAALSNGAMRYALLIALVLLPTILRTMTLAGGADIGSYLALFQNFRSPFHLTFDGLAIGTLVAFLQADGVIRRLGALPRHAILAIALAALACLMLRAPMMAQIDAFDATLQPLLIALAFGGILMVVLDREGQAGWLGARPLFVIAILSYTLYLVHMPLIPLATVIAIAFGGTFQPMIFGIAVLALSFMAALLIHFGVEKPFLILKDMRASQAK